MKVPERLDAALARLQASLRQLEAAQDRRADADAARADQDQEFMLLQEDRIRLAQELDEALARTRALEAATRDVSGRLDRAGAAVEAILAEVTAAPQGSAPAATEE